MAKPLIDRTSNVSDATLKKHIRVISGLKTSLDSAQGEYRAALKGAKTAGINTGQLIAAMAAKKREFDDVKGDLRQYLRYMALLDMPVQLDMFSDAAEEPADGEAEADETDEAEADEADDDEHAQWKAQEAGVAAGTAGRFKDDNPHQAGTAVFVAWQNGWAKGQETLIAKGGVKRASPRRSRAADPRLN